MSTVNFSDEIFAEEALQAFTSGLVSVLGFSNDFSDSIATEGATVNVPRFDALEATTFDQAANNGHPYEGEGGNVGTIKVQLDKHLIVPVDISDVQALNSSQANVQKFAKQQGSALARKVLAAIFDLVSLANFGNAIAGPIPLASFDARMAQAARRVMVTRNVPAEELNLVASAELYEVLAADPNVARQSWYGDEASIQTGKVPRLSGMGVYETNALPLGGTLSLVGFVAHPDAIALATRNVISQHPERYDVHEVITDADTGLSFTYKRHFSPGKGKTFANLECLFGLTVGLSAGLGLLRRSD